MRRGRSLILVLLIVIVLLAVGFFALNQFLKPQQNTATSDQAVYVDVYYAAQNIPQGGKITEDVLATLRIPQENVVTVMYTTDELPFLVDKIARYPLDQGVLLTEPMVTDSTTSVSVSGPQWASIIPPGMTAMTIPINRLTAAGYSVNNGAHVNLNVCLLFVDVDPTFQTMLPNLTAALTGTGIGPDGALPVLALAPSAAGTAQGRLELDPSVQQPYYVLPSEAQRPREVCQTLLQDVVVMRLGDFPLSGQELAPVDPATQTDPAAQQAAASSPSPDIITLIVSPQDSITLSYLMYTNAQISLTLRNPSDQTRLATEASTLQFLLSQYNIPVPAKLPYAMHPPLGSIIPLVEFQTPQLPNDVVEDQQQQP
ncbi:hypothetical protein MASR2M66_21020 [Chloroflexota bacterium]